MPALFLNLSAQSLPATRNFSAPASICEGRFCVFNRRRERLSPISKPQCTANPVLQHSRKNVLPAEGEQYASDCNDTFPTLPCLST